LDPFNTGSTRLLSGESSGQYQIQYKLAKVLVKIMSATSLAIDSGFQAIIFSQNYVEDVVSAWPSKHVQYAHEL